MLYNGIRSCNMELRAVLVQLRLPDVVQLLLKFIKAKFGIPQILSGDERKLALL